MAQMRETVCPGLMARSLQSPVSRGRVKCRVVHVSPLDWFLDSDPATIFTSWEASSATPDASKDRLKMNRSVMNALPSATQPSHTSAQTREQETEKEPFLLASVVDSQCQARAAKAAKAEMTIP